MSLRYELVRLAGADGANVLLLCERFGISRKTGYKGPIVGSCWQAGDFLGHFYNLHSDYLAGISDRHNYFGGRTGHRLGRGPVDKKSMVSLPGSGLLGTGMQQVIDRPFAISEWISMIPNEWVAEGSPIVAVYGMGLQGWDASYSFGTNYPHYTPTIEAPWVYNVDSPTQIGLYPALARMVYRGDVKEGDTVAVRNIYVPDLLQGKVGFDDAVKQSGDVKSFGGQTPPEALAAGKVVLAFTEEPKATEAAKLDGLWDRRKKTVRSNTGQLFWDYSGKGFFTVDTPGTKAVVGFASGKTHQLGEVAVRVETPFAVVFVTSLDPEKPIKTADSLLVTAVARAQNTGMRYSGDRSRVEAKGKAPILLEPVKAAVAIKRRGRAPKVYALDHDGKRTATTVPVRGGQFVIDGARYRTLYYEVDYK